MIESMIPALFALSACAGGAVIDASLRRALPLVRGLAAERRSLAADRVWLITMIETPRHQTGTPPRPECDRAAIAGFPSAAPRGALAISRPLRQAAAPAWREAA